MECLILHIAINQKKTALKHWKEHFLYFMKCLGCKIFMLGSQDSTKDCLKVRIPAINYESFSIENVNLNSNRKLFDRG